MRKKQGPKPFHSNVKGQVRCAGGGGFGREMELFTRKLVGGSLQPETKRLLLINTVFQC